MRCTSSIIIISEPVQIVKYPPNAAVRSGRSRKNVIVTLIEGEGIISRWA